MRLWTNLRWLWKRDHRHVEFHLPFGLTSLSSTTVFLPRTIRHLKSQSEPTVSYSANTGLTPQATGGYFSLGVVTPNIQIHTQMPILYGICVSECGGCDNSALIIIIGSNAQSPVANIYCQQHLSRACRNRTDKYRPNWIKKKCHKLLNLVNTTVFHKRHVPYTRASVIFAPR